MFQKHHLSYLLQNQYEEKGEPITRLTPLPTALPGRGRVLSELRDHGMTRPTAPTVTSVFTPTLTLTLAMAMVTLVPTWPSRLCHRLAAVSPVPTVWLACLPQISSKPARDGEERLSHKT